MDIKIKQIAKIMSFIIVTSVNKLIHQVTPVLRQKNVSFTISHKAFIVTGTHYRYPIMLLNIYVLSYLPRKSQFHHAHL